MPYDSGDRRAKGSPIWLIIFADITTNLMLFFLMLFSMTRMSDSERQMAIAGVQGALKTEGGRMDEGERLAKKIREENASRGLKETIASGEIAGVSAFSESKDTIKVTLNPNAFFSTGSAELSPSARGALHGLSVPLKEFPQGTAIVIEGHTDNVPVHGGGSNWELSIARAVSVIDFFTSLGVPAERFVAGGYGEYHPAFPNDTEEGRAKNRRIEITILKKPGVTSAVREGA